MAGERGAVGRADHPLDRFGVEEAVLGVDHQEIEAREGEELDDGFRGRRQEAAQQGLPGPETRAERAIRHFSSFGSAPG